MTRAQQFRLLLILLLAFAPPAYANNPPQPDGLFSVLLIFPIAILGARLAGVVPEPKRRLGIIVGMAIGVLSTMLLMAGTALGVLAALGVLVYAIVRGGEIIRRGRTARRSVIGTVVMAFAVLAFLDYYVSIMSFYPSSALSEARAVSGVRSLNMAESEFAKRGQSDNSPSGAFGTLKDLESAKLIDDAFSNGRIRKGYRYGEIVDPVKEQFFFYAIPAPELKPDHYNFVPGASLLKSILGGRHEEGTGYRSFAVDETGLIRWAIRTRTGPVTREEAHQWPSL